MLKLILLLVFSSQSLALTWGPLFVQPEQIHLSWGADETEMIVTWVTFDLPKTPTVRFAKVGHYFDKVATGSTKMFVDGGTEKRVLYIHRVTLKNLEPDTRYHYHCGSADGWSPVFEFKTNKAGHEWSPKFCVYGDLGNINGVAIGRIQDEVQSGRFDAVIHVGDIAYDLFTDNARVGDEFMRQIEPIAAYAPYQVLPGNHERQYNFSNYDNRFSIVSSNSSQISNHFWSYDIGPVHFIAYSTEFYFFTEYGKHQIGNQYRWLEEDLKKANEPERRKKRPWIIAMGHRPLYAQNHVDQVLVKGYDFKDGKGPQFGLDELFYKYGVDVQIYGHEHNYERLYPVYDNKVYNNSGNPYKNPKAPVHVITGSAGCRERHTPIKAKRPDYSALVMVDYGFTRMTVHNGTHLYMEQVSEDKNGAIIDKFYIVQESHGPFK